MLNKKYIYWNWKKNENDLIKKSKKQEKRIVENDVETEIIKIEENKRSLCSNRISDREMIIQTNINPFLQTNDYINDLSQQEKFLRPKDSNIEKI
jgi:hypothetical protein